MLKFASNTIMLLLVLVLVSLPQSGIAQDPAIESRTIDTPKLPNKFEFEKPQQRLAQATCVALNPGAGWTYAVPRQCGNTVASCNQICKTLLSRIPNPQPGRTSCFNALHIYGGNEPTDTYHTAGFKTYKYNSCTGNFCGPNYCCCAGHY